jgi:hypothetical protein
MSTVEIISGYHEFDGDIVGKGTLQVSKGEFEFQGNHPTVFPSVVDLPLGIEFALPVAILDGEHAVLSFHSPIKLPKLSLLEGTLSGGASGINLNLCFSFFSNVWS